MSFSNHFHGLRRRLIWWQSALAVAHVIRRVLALHVFLDRLRLFAVEVQLLDGVDLLVQALDLELVGVHLRLVVLELLDHLLELIGSLLQVLLVHLQLFSDLWAGLLGQDVLQLNVELLLLLNEYVLLGDFLCFGDEPFLQGLDLLDHFISVRVGALQLPPSVDIERLLELVHEVLGLLLLLKILFLEQVDLPLQIRDARSLILRHDQLPFVICDPLPNVHDIVQAILIVDFTLVEGTLLYLNLLIEQ